MTNLYSLPLCSGRSFPCAGRSRCRTNQRTATSRALTRHLPARHSSLRVDQKSSLFWTSVLNQCHLDHGVFNQRCHMVLNSRRTGRRTVDTETKSRWAGIAYAGLPPFYPTPDKVRSSVKSSRHIGKDSQGHVRREDGPEALLRVSSGAKAIASLRFRLIVCPIGQCHCFRPQRCGG